jgi:threonylcarbamoyladenosine tRNA methylthiotransferase MtaB
MATYHVENFGCRATQADGAAIERQFEGWALARADAADADFVVLNTCTVTHSADQDARAAIRRARRQNPAAKIIVTGCYAQRAPQEIAALPGVTAVIGNSHKHRLAEIVLRNTSSTVAGGTFESSRESAFFPLTGLTGTRPALAGDSIYVSDIFAHTDLLAAPVFESSGERSQGSRTRPNLKVQDGCDNRCSFCVIPSVRGHSRSLPLPRVVDEARALVAAGYRELVISGINLGRWGRDLDDWHAASGSLLTPNTEFRKPRAQSQEQTFEDLLRAILAQTEIEKLRISSVEPMDWTDELIRLAADSPRIAKHAHVPLQSGSDTVLRRMHRKYRPWHYREKIEKIHAAMPEAAIGADVMAGFPGETAADFEATRGLIEELPFTYLHVFTYSQRPGTPAASMANQVPIQVANDRSRILRELARVKKLAFMRRFLGKTLSAITLGRSPDLQRAEAVSAPVEFTEALTDNYQKLYLRGRHDPNRWLAVCVETVQDGAFLGRLA